MKRVVCLILAAMMIFACAAAETAAPMEVQDGVVEIIGPVASAEVVGAESAAPETTNEPAVTPEPTQVPRLAGLRIGIDPGHQGQANSDREPVAPGSSEKKAKVSSGTSGRSTGIPEYITVLEISQKLRHALEAEGCTVYMTRESHDVDISNKERAELMNELGVDLVLRIHCDGVDDKSVNGIGLYVRKTGEKQQESEEAARILLETMTQATGAKKRGVFLRDTYTMNNWSVVPCILVECGYMTNHAEDEKLNDPAYQDLLAQGMVEGIAAYFGR